MNFTKLFPLTFCVLCLYSLTNCSNEDDFGCYSDLENMKELYQKTHSYQQVSLLNLSESQGRHQLYGIETVPVITDDDLNFLASLSQSEMIKHISELTSIINKSTTDYELKTIENAEKIYNILGNVENFEQLKIFAEDYINTDKGWQNLSSLFPINLNSEQQTIYIAMALYIDNIGRPIYNYLTEKNSTQSRNELCRMQLSIDLAAAGIELGVDGFLEVMTGGALTLLEEGALAVTAESIWYKYETCEGRWH